MAPPQTLSFVSVALLGSLAAVSGCCLLQNVAYPLPVGGVDYPIIVGSDVEHHCMLNNGVVACW